jgi:asparagine synthase (glutamine-hydrolysing)
MTLLSGAYCRHHGDVVPNRLSEAIKQTISRHSGEAVEEFSDGRCFLAKVDIGAYGERGVSSDSRAVSFLTGEPLLASSDHTARSRADDLSELHNALLEGDALPLRRARGVFTLAHYQPASGALVLLTDKLGIRPLYIALGERYVIFASALRILERLAEVPKAMNVRAVTEIGAIGFPLADRTPFASVRLMAPGELLRVEGERTSCEYYWRWTDVGATSRPVEDLAAETYRTLVEAIALRQRTDRTSIAFLSGGLDSRSIVMALRNRGVSLHTFNFSPQGTQDAVFGGKFAERIGTIHTQVGSARGEPNWAKLMSGAWSASPHRDMHPAERPKLVWSGDGGSVGLGHVYLSPAIVQEARDGRPEVAAEIISRKWGGDVPWRLLRRGVRNALLGLASKGLLDEFTSLQNVVDPGRALHLVLMHNDQHRHLSEFFETIDTHRLEYHLPFFDSEFLTSVLRVPIDECLGHKYYMRVARHFPPPMLEVPWQAYPEHEPCPLPVPTELKYQWELRQERAFREAERRDLLEDAAKMLRSRSFPGPILNRWYLRLASLLYRLNLRETGYVIRAARVFCRYWAIAAGEFVLPGKRAAR